MTTYRYGIVTFGVNYAPGDVNEPDHVIMAESIQDARERLWLAARGNPRGETGAGQRTADTPVYGNEGDGAYLYRVRRDDPGFSEVLDEPGNRARHAFEWLDKEPACLLEFGPRWGFLPRVVSI